MLMEVLILELNIGGCSDYEMITWGIYEYNKILANAHKSVIDYELSHKGKK